MSLHLAVKTLHAHQLASVMEQDPMRGGGGGEDARFTAITTQEQPTTVICYPDGFNAELLEGIHTDASPQ